MNETVLITGGAGFIGSHLCEMFLKRGSRVICVDDFSTGQKKNIALFEKNQKLFTFVQADVSRNWGIWQHNLPETLLASVDHVFHFASPASPPHYQRLALETMWVNTLGLQNALNFANSVGAHLVFASTSEVYGDPNCSPQPETYWGNVNSFGPRSCYDEAKRFGESLIYTWNEKHQTRHGMVRIFNTYGPRMHLEDGRVVINFLTQASRNKPLTIYGDGRQTRSFCFVDDLIQAIDKYSEAELSEPVNIGNDKEFTILELADIVNELYGIKHPFDFKPLPKDDPTQRRPDLTKAKKMLSPWEPRIELREGLTMMKRWLESEGHL